MDIQRSNKKITIIEIKIDNADLIDCPLSSDLNTCKIADNSPVNHCPKCDDTNFTFHAPKDCPLRTHSVIITSE